MHVIVHKCYDVSKWLRKLVAPEVSKKAEGAVSTLSRADERDDSGKDARTGEMGRSRDFK